MSDPNEVICVAGRKTLTRGRAEAVVADRVNFLTTVCDILESSGAALASQAEIYGENMPEERDALMEQANRCNMAAVCIGSVLLPQLRDEAAS